jgi:hypothetical protein
MNTNFPLQPLQIAPLPRISPSRFTSLQMCVLREACTAAKQPALLPSSPKAALGSIAHRLLELAGRGELPDSENGIAEKWDGLVTAAEARMQTSILERRWLPLHTSVADYHVRRIRACNAALSLARDVQDSRESEATEVTDGEKTVFEQPVETPDKLVSGVIDCLFPTPQGWILRDYKTGPILEAASESTVKSAYQMQLKLYAAILWSQKGYWPVNLELVPMDGPVVAVPFEADECLELLEAAKSALRAANARIQSTLSANPSPLETLASPSPAACQYCPFRPGCKGYWQFREAQPEERWPQDACGTLQKFQPLANGKVALQINMEAGKIGLVRMENDATLHPALENLKSGQSVAVYNLAARGAGNVWDGTVHTVIYCSNDRA